MRFNILFTKIYKRKVDDNRGVEADRKRLESLEMTLKRMPWNSQCSEDMSAELCSLSMSICDVSKNKFSKGTKRNKQTKCQYSTNPSFSNCLIIYKNKSIYKPWIYKNSYKIPNKF